MERCLNHIEHKDSFASARLNNVCCCMGGVLWASLPGLIFADVTEYQRVSNKEN